VRRALGAVGLGLAVALATASFASSAGAQEDRSQVLFDRAKQLANAHKYEEACPLLEESLALDPALGTMFNLADCYEHIGRTASAWRLFAKVEGGAHAAAQAEREIRAHDRAAALANRVAKLTIEVPPAAREPNLRVTADGETVLPTSYGVAMAVDVGAHKIAAEAPGLAPWHEDVQVPSDGATITVRVPVLQMGPGASAPAAGSAPPAAAQPVPPEPASGGGRRTLGYAIGGVGLVGVAAGAIFGGLAASKHTDCAGGCVGAERDRQSQAYVYGNVSTISLAVGGVALASAAILILTGRAPERHTAER
jgi:hypothetical protein